MGNSLYTPKAVIQLIAVRWQAGHGAHRQHRRPRYGAGEVIRGLAHLNPADLATGTVLKETTAQLKHLRYSNRAVRRLFEAIEDAQAGAS